MDGRTKRKSRTHGFKILIKTLLTQISPEILSNYLLNFVSRPLVYPNTDVFLLCFSVVSPSSFLNIREKWIPEIKKSREKGQKKHVPIILVGTQSDLRNDVNTRVELAKYKEQPVTENEARKLAKDLGCENFIETSALTQHNLKEVFDEAIMASLKGRKIKEKMAAKKAARQQGCNCAIL